MCLQGPENSDIERLGAMGSVRREAKQLNVVFFGEFSHFCCRVRAMTIVDEQDGLS
jgi:hypothetical protein